jgi:Spy/CpxP family protein refolding chaperone
MTTRYRFLSVFLATVFLLGSAVVFSGQGAGPMAFEPQPQFGQRFQQGPRAGHRHGVRGRMSQRLIEELQLSEEQLSQIKEQRQQHRDEMQALHEQQRGLRQEMRSLLESESPSATEVGEKAIAIHNLSLQMRQEREAMQESFRALLTPEQAQRLDELKDRGPMRHRRR